MFCIDFGKKPKPEILTNIMQLTRTIMIFGTKKQIMQSLIIAQYGCKTRIFY